MFSCIFRNNNGILNFFEQPYVSAGSKQMHRHTARAVSYFASFKVLQPQQDFSVNCAPIQRSPFVKCLMRQKYPQSFTRGSWNLFLFVGSICLAMHCSVYKRRLCLCVSHVQEFRIYIPVEIILLSGSILIGTSLSKAHVYSQPHLNDLQHISSVQINCLLFL